MLKLIFLITLMLFPASAFGQLENLDSVQLIESKYKGFDIYKINKNFVAVPFMEGPFDFNNSQIKKFNTILYHYNFDENILDITNNSKATITGQKTFDDGISGKAISFDGGKNFLTIQTPDILQSKEFTITFWLKRTSESDQFDHILSHVNTNKTAGFVFDTLSNQNLRLVMFNEEKSQFIPTKIFLPLDTFIHIISTFDGKTVKLYKNGELAGKAEVIGNYTNPQELPLRLASAASFNGNYWQGEIDELRIYDRVLSDEEADLLYNGDEVELDILKMSPKDGGFSAVFQGISLNEVKKNIDSGEIVGPYIIEEYKDHTILMYGGLYYGVNQIKEELDLQRFTNWEYKKSLAANSINELRSLIDFPVSNYDLLQIWNNNKNLQLKFPEVANNDLKNLEEWAKNVGWNEEPSLSILVPDDETPHYLHPTQTTNYNLFLIPIIVAIISAVIGFAINYFKRLRNLINLR